ncbi:STAS domain-containing protein [Nocardia goodfellowii]|uniref:Anti-sigma factor antagonist n=1 Tax=Nocardia goodfellowii TaxID=882446 RepID=A0ABS4QGQ4_9NOCA|nr:STAS domain-containing protein [Nocardia goodfellowii]MBP2190874.1 anti-anti-sigma factor [Nocardia goodfellowii]
MSAESGPGSLEIGSRTEAATVIVAVRGEIDMASAPQLEAGLNEVLRKSPTTVVVDMSDVGFLGSAGLSVLLGASRSYPSTDLRIVATDAARRPMELTGLDQMLAVFDSLAEALAVGEPTAS